MSYNFYLKRKSVSPFYDSFSNSFKSIYELLGSNRVSTKQRHVSSEIFYDSLVPRIDELLKTEGAKPAFVTGLTDTYGVGLFLLSNCGVNFEDVVPSVDTQSSYYASLRSFPFENKFFTNRQKVLPKSYEAFRSQSGKPEIVRSIAFEIINEYETSLTSRRRTILLDFLYSTSNFVPSRTEELYKFFFGFGDSLDTIYNGSNLVQTLVNSPTFTSLTISALSSSNSSQGRPKGLDIAFGVRIRGWKYGIYNAVPTSTTCVFRRNKYGQFRDMLEQRPFSVFFDYENNKPTDGPVEVKFVKQVQTGSAQFMEGSFTYIDPYDSVTLNKSQFVTSSIPYFDI